MEYKDYELLCSTDVQYALNISRAKFLKLVKDGFLVPYKSKPTRAGKPAHLFSPVNVLKVKKQLTSEGYEYKNAQ